MAVRVTLPAIASKGGFVGDHAVPIDLQAYLGACLSLPTRRHRAKQVQTSFPEAL